MKTRTCTQCKHYYVTWDASKPHGCRAFGFKSKEPPDKIVRQSSKMACKLFSPRKRIQGTK